MPGCAAVGCTNSRKKGFIMKYFPKDPARRKEWSVKMKRDKWVPTDHSVLCEVHFEHDMWENPREDGKKKLKFNAVPTLFSFSNVQRKRRPPVPRNIISKKDNFVEEMEVSTEPIIAQQTSTSTASFPTVQLINIPPSTSSSSLESACSLFKSDSQAEKIEALKMYKRAFSKSLQYKKSLRNANNKIKRLQKRIVNLEEENIQQLSLKNVFNKDQVDYLNKKSQTRTTQCVAQWSNETVKKALKLRFSCGTTGYEELIRQNIPLPSIRTLQRRLQNLKFDSGILHEVFDFLKIKTDVLNMQERDCVLVLDEMAITPGKTYDMSLNKYFGYVTLPEHEGLATHTLVFMLGAVNTRWYKY